MREPPKIRSCINCRYMMWLVGVGQGIRCDNAEKNTLEGTELFRIPSREYCCEHFEPKQDSRVELPRLPGRP